MTKYIGGHGNSLGGMIVDSGNFPWAEHADRYPMLTQPEPAYHGVVYTEAFGPAAYIARARTVPLRNTGSAISPLNAFLILQGIETLALRMERHVENAMAVAEYLKGHDRVAWVHYAGLPDSPYYELAQKYTGGRPSGLLSFGVKGGYEPGVQVLRRPQALQAPRQHRRRPLAGRASRLDHASPDDRGRAGLRQRHAGHHPPVRRHRAHRRHHRRPRPGPRGRRQIALRHPETAVPQQGPRSSSVRDRPL